jgi:late competence protein required for DNA uptake (superfamily II DNA/RNA helicase)
MCDICRRTPCAPQCPNFEDEPLLYCDRCERAIYADDTYYEIGGIYCENCMENSKRTADRDNSYHSGQPAISYGDKWED